MVQPTATYQYLNGQFPEMAFWFDRGLNYKLKSDFKEQENMMLIVHGKTTNFKLNFRNTSQNKRH